MIRLATPSSKIAPVAICIVSCVVFLATSSFASKACWGQANTSQADDLQPLIDEVESLASQVDDAKAKKLIEARLIGIQYLSGEKEAAAAAWEDLLESVLDVDGEPEPERTQKGFSSGVLVSQMAGVQLRLGNEPLAMMALERLDGTVGSFFCYIGLVVAAGDRNDLELAEKLYEKAKVDDSVQVSSRRNFGMNLEGALIHAQIQCGDLEGALNSLRKIRPEDIARNPLVANELKVAASAVRARKLELAERLLRPILDALEKNQNGLQFKSEFVQANMLWAKLNPSELQARWGSCLEMLETHEGVNGPEGGYYALASHLAEMGKFDLATQAIGKLEQENMQQRAYKNIAVCQAEQGNLMEAETTLDSIHVESIKREAELSIAKEAYALGKREKARQMLAESINRALASQQKEIQLPSSFLPTAAKLQARWNIAQPCPPWIMELRNAELKSRCLLIFMESQLASQSP